MGVTLLRMLLEKIVLDFKKRVQEVVFFFLSLFILRECACTQAGERQRENSKQVLHCQREARRGAQSHEPGDHDVS